MKLPFRLVVTGSRHWTDVEPIHRKLSLVVRGALMEAPSVVLIHGGARGADAIAAMWARHIRLKVEEFKADFEKLGPPAGPIRNRQMLDAGADLVVGFPWGRPEPHSGTWDCIHEAAGRGIPISVIPRRP